MAALEVPVLFPRFHGVQCRAAEAQHFHCQASILRTMEEVSLLVAACLPAGLSGKSLY